ncbi:M23 family metallopeptidase [Polaribacter sp. Hel_I_88]|uniref:M23 family metallopeptidase n=1 Tax=Polaribacter sp. Hel_I_88 TaxID=1250006 RepID=UPI00047BDB1A|nr:M23 family metallopeptidase [Polaribacter sp. Hel_I_88]
MKINIKIILVFLCFAACKQVQNLSDKFTKPSGKQVIESTFKDNDTLSKKFEDVYEQAKNNNLELVLPSVIYTKSDSLDFSILSYKIFLEKGERLKIETNIDSDSLQFASDIYSVLNDTLVSKNSIVSNEASLNHLNFEVFKTGYYKIVMFSEFTKKVDFNISVYTEPVFLFPVAGKGNKDIQSYWGAVRSGGKRKHEGIDIFAKRGTPVIASVDGFVATAKNSGLGGKQIWLKSGLFGKTLYYAHLDSITTSAGAYVKLGDTLGFVGNTGNAKGASPHLHFGIYNSSGAINPLAFVKKSYLPNSIEEKVFKNGITKLTKNELRIGSGVAYKKIETFTENTPITILGKIDNWFHIKYADNIEGFMHESLVAENI